MRSTTDHRRLPYGIEPADVVGAGNAYALLLDDAAMAFFELTIITAHYVGGWWCELLALVTHHAKICIDLSGWQVHWRKKPAQYYRKFGEVSDQLGPERMLFASDHQAYDAFLPLDIWAGTFGSPAEDGLASADVKFNREEMRPVLGENPVRVLGARR